MKKITILLFMCLTMVVFSCVSITNMIQNGNIEKAEEAADKMEGEKRDEAFMELGDYYLSSRNYDKAASCYEKTSFDIIPLYSKIADIAFDNKDYYKSAFYYKKSDDFDSIIKVANICLENKYYQIAYDVYLLSNEDPIKFSNSIADTAYVNQDYFEAADYYKKAGNNEKIIEIAKNFLTNKEYENSQKIFSKSNLSSDKYNSIIADYAYKQKDYEKAGKYYHLGSNIQGLKKVGNYFQNQANKINITNRELKSDFSKFVSLKTNELSDKFYDISHINVTPDKKGLYFLDEYSYKNNYPYYKLYYYEFETEDIKLVEDLGKGYGFSFAFVESKLFTGYKYNSRNYFKMLIIENGEVVEKQPKQSFETLTNVNGNLVFLYKEKLYLMDIEDFSKKELADDVDFIINNFKSENKIIIGKYIKDTNNDKKVNYKDYSYYYEMTIQDSGEVTEKLIIKQTKSYDYSFFSPYNGNYILLRKNDINKDGFSYNDINNNDIIIYNPYTEKSEVITEELKDYSSLRFNKDLNTLFYIESDNFSLPFDFKSYNLKTKKSIKLKEVSDYAPLSLTFDENWQNIYFMKRIDTNEDDTINYKDKGKLSVLKFYNNPITKKIDYYKKSAKYFALANDVNNVIKIANTVLNYGNYNNAYQIANYLDKENNDFIKNIAKKAYANKDYYIAMKYFKLIKDNDNLNKMAYSYYKNNKLHESLNLYRYTDNKEGLKNVYIKFLTHDILNDRKKAYKYLSEIDFKSNSKDINAYYSGANGNFDNCVKIGKSMGNYLISWLQDDDDIYVENAINAIIKINDLNLILDAFDKYPKKLNTDMISILKPYLDSKDKTLLEKVSSIMIRKAPKNYYSYCKENDKILNFILVSVKNDVENQAMKGFKKLIDEMNIEDIEVFEESSNYKLIIDYMSDKILNLKIYDYENVDDLMKHFSKYAELIDLSLEKKMYYGFIKIMESNVLKFDDLISVYIDKSVSYMVVASKENSDNYMQLATDAFTTSYIFQTLRNKYISFLLSNVRADKDKELVLPSLISLIKIHGIIEMEDTDYIVEYLEEFLEKTEDEEIIKKTEELLDIVESEE